MRRARAVLLEALIVGVVGLLVALMANALSPRGLRLNRNYFPHGETLPLPTATTSKSNVIGTTAKAAQAPSSTVERLQQRGLQLLSSNQVVELFHDPRREQGLAVFVDARNDQHYSAGHIPGAWQFDHYRAENYLPTVLPVCLTALQVVVYCSGGECEDSEFAALMLRDAGIPRENLFVYPGGISEWKASGLPLETGIRGSGQFLKNAP